MTLSRTFADVTIPAAGVYEIDPAHTFVVFRVRHLVRGRVVGRFDTFDGEITVIEDAERLFGGFDVSFDANSVDTQVKMRDDDLRSARFFDVEHFPTVRLSGGDSRHADGNRWTVVGELTILDISRSVSMDDLVPVSWTRSMRIGPSGKGIEDAEVVCAGVSSACSGADSLGPFCGGGGCRDRGERGDSVQVAGAGSD